MKRTGAAKQRNNFWQATPTLTVYMMKYESGTVVLIAFPYTNGGGVKKRPALVLYDNGDPDIVVARITSQTVTTHDDILIKDQDTAGLLIVSRVRLHKVATLDKKLIDRTLGHLSDTDQRVITMHLQSAALAL
jgi:mRNA interferase MazF